MAFRTNKVPAIEERTVSGSSVSFNSAFALPLKACKVSFSATQAGSGTPSPSNPRPISGYSAINIGSDAKYAGFINFNQLVKNGNFETQSEWTGSRCNYTVSTNVATISITGAAGTTKQLYQTGNVIQDHKMFICLEANPSKETNVMFRIDKVSGSPEKQCAANVWTDVSGIKNITANTSNADVNIYGMTSLENGDTVQVRNAIVIDLTEMFGSTKADEIYTMERQTAGSGVSYVRTLFPNDYYAYNAGTLTTVSAANGVSGSMNTIQIGSTVYGGEYDARTGVLTVTHKYINYPTINLTTISIQSGGVCGNFTCPVDDINRGKWSVVSAPILSMFDGSKGLSEGGISKGYSANEYTVFVPDVTTKADAEAALTGMQMVYTLANPILIQLPPCPIDTLEGENNIWADTGDIDLTYKDLDIAKRGSFREVFRLPS